MDRYHEPTMEELDALIAERMQHLPRWWHDGAGGDDGPNGRCRVCGRTMPLAAHGLCHRDYKRQRRQEGKS